MKRLVLSIKAQVTYDTFQLGERDQAAEYVAGRRVRFSDRRACRLRRDACTGTRRVPRVDANGLGDLRGRFCADDPGRYELQTERP